MLLSTELSLSAPPARKELQRQRRRKKRSAVAPPSPFIHQPARRHLPPPHTPPHYSLSHINMVVYYEILGQKVGSHIVSTPPLATSTCARPSCHEQRNPLTGYAHESPALHRRPHHPLRRNMVHDRRQEDCQRKPRTSDQRRQ